MIAIYAPIQEAADRLEKLVDLAIAGDEVVIIWEGTNMRLVPGGLKQNDRSEQAE